MLDGDRRGSTNEQEGRMEEAAASPFANSASAASPSTLKRLSVSGRLSRSFSKLGLTRMSSSGGVGGSAVLSRRSLLLLDEGKSR